MRILLIEDEKALNEIAAEQIARRGHEVLIAESIQEAVEILMREAAQLDCIVADHRLPDGQGVRLCIECRQKFPHLAIGVVSGCLTAIDRRRLEEADIPYWRKPVLYSAVMEKLTAICLPGQTSQAPGTPPIDAPVLDRPLVAATKEETDRQWKLQETVATTPDPSNGPSWPSACEPMQRLNHAAHLAGSSVTRPPIEKAPEKKGLTRRLFSFGRGRD